MSLWDDYSSVRAATEPPAQLRHAGLVRQLAELQAAGPQAMSVVELGKSVEGRAISCVTLGSGPVRVLAWSQMHGNEPTHTVVLLDLINLLQQFPEHPSAQAILAGCTLHLIPMLNPDGVELWTRRNAQSIDVNRDALHFQSPEGRLLRQAVHSHRPHFALNLHNQGPRTSVGSASPQVAAVSLLVPPLDSEETETEWTRQAKQVAACFLRAVSPHYLGMISRYDADFMPRCFGEWVQQQGVATLTVEAGGWLTPSQDLMPLVQLHFVGLVSALEALATEAYLQADPAQYDSLPRSGEHDLFDRVIRGVTVLSGGTQPMFIADLGVNYSVAAGQRSQAHSGAIEDLGDVCVTTGKVLIDGTDLVCVPGRISYAPDISPTRLPDVQRVCELLATGVTTVIGQVDLSKRADVEALDKLPRLLEIPINLGFIATVAAAAGTQSEEIQERLMFAASRGILGVLEDGVSAEASRLLEWFQIPLLQDRDLPVAPSESVTLEDISLHTHEVAGRLGIHDRGSIRLGSVADLLLLRSEGLPNSRAIVQWSDLQQVMVAGSVVFDGGDVCGEVGGGVSGVLLTSRLARQPNSADG
jgi:hypothetical protein